MNHDKKLFSGTIIKEDVKLSTKLIGNFFLQECFIYSGIKVLLILSVA